MLVIKSLSRRSKSFGQLLRYFWKEGRDASTDIGHNLPLNGRGRGTVQTTFLENAQYLKARKNGIVLYHEILSFHPDDKMQLSPVILQDMANQYLQTRAPEGLGYGVIHWDKKNPHVHLMLSANKLNSSQKIRLSKKRFQQVKDKVSLYLKEQYPQLSATLAKRTNQPEQQRKTTVSRAEEGMNTRNKTNKQVSQKHQAKKQMENLIQQSTSLDDLKTKLQQQGDQLYIRGKQQGVIWSGKKYRLKTLGLLDLWQQQQQIWQRTKTREKAIQETLLQKVVREWKSLGFKEQVLYVLKHKQQNKYLSQLRETVERKQKRGRSFRSSCREY